MNFRRPTLGPEVEPCAAGTAKTPEGLRTAFEMYDFSCPYELLRLHAQECGERSGCRALTVGAVTDQVARDLTRIAPGYSSAHASSGEGWHRLISTHCDHRRSGLQGYRNSASVAFLTNE